MLKSSETVVMPRSIVALAQKALPGGPYHIGELLQAHRLPVRSKPAPGYLGLGAPREWRPSANMAKRAIITDTEVHDMP